MGEKRSIFVGRAIENQKRSLAVSPTSNLDFSEVFPVSFRSFLVLRSRMVGPYVSLITSAAIIVKTPVCFCQPRSSAQSGRTPIASAQKFHRQPTRSEMNA